MTVLNPLPKSLESFLCLKASTYMRQPLFEVLSNRIYTDNVFEQLSGKSSPSPRPDREILQGLARAESRQVSRSGV
jgi:hypothetical protein